MDTQTLQTELLDLLGLLQHLNPLHLNTVCQFLHHNKEDLLLDRLTALLRSITPAQVDGLISLSVNSPTAPTLSQPDQSTGVDEELEKLPKELISSFGLLLQIYQLYQLLNKLSILQLMKIFEFVPAAPQVQQLQLLQQLQQLLGQLLPETLLSLHQELEATQPGSEQQVLAQLLQLRKEHFHLYQPLRMLLQLESDELLGLQDVLPKLQPTQMLQLLALLQLQPFDVLELKRVLQVRAAEQVVESIDLQVPQTPAIQPLEFPLQQSTSSPSPRRPMLRIIEQPPEKSVYKRNLKPNPTIQLVEDDTNMESNLYIAPVLIRCDTLEEKPKLMTGNKPVKVAPGRVVTFRRLKITSTSHQQGESLFAIKFELRRYHGNEYEILDFVQSNPICVLSHSTQLKPASSATATVTEVIPYSGPTLGGTRVAVLGNNFVDSPSSRVRFDDIDVVPIFHGPRTLICTTPQHQPGIVSVRVSNDSKIWSVTSASFTYEDRPAPVPQSLPTPVTNQFHLGLDIASSICEAAWQGGYEMDKGDDFTIPHDQTSGNGGPQPHDSREGQQTSLKVQHSGDRSIIDHQTSIDQPDGRGYHPLHYAAAEGDEGRARHLLTAGASPTSTDRAGNLPLHWASAHAHHPLVRLLLHHHLSPTPLSAPPSGFRGDGRTVRSGVDTPNCQGVTPLHLAAAVGCEPIVRELLQFGACPNLPSGVGGESALHRAAACGHIDVVGLLVGHGAFVNARDDLGETPLHYAVREGLPSVISVLLAHGADPALPNDDCETPLHLASVIGNKEVTRLLIASGAQPKMRSESLLPSAHIPLHEGCQGGHGLEHDCGSVEAGAKEDVLLDKYEPCSSLSCLDTGVDDLGSTDIVSALLLAGTRLSLTTTKQCCGIYKNVFLYSCGPFCGSLQALQTAVM
jgi:ankyrin repeat protein